MPKTNPAADHVERARVALLTNVEDAKAEALVSIAESLIAIDATLLGIDDKLKTLNSQAHPLAQALNTLADRERGTHGRALRSNAWRSRTTRQLARHGQSAAQRGEQQGSA